MKKPTYPRIQENNVTIETKKGYRTYYNCLDVNNFKKTYGHKLDCGDDIWYSKSNMSRKEVLIGRFIYEDKNIKATVKIFYNKNWMWHKWISGRIDRVDALTIKCNKWKTTKAAPTPYAPTGYHQNFAQGGCTKNQAIKWVKSLAKNKANVRRYNKAIKEAA
tara:strand:- start:31 stop:516 length:486 start_codon:yes stop_codon:yes gene_type:complete